jgi:hypothetical protein
MTVVVGDGAALILPDINTLDGLSAELSSIWRNMRYTFCRTDRLGAGMSLKSSAVELIKSAFEDAGHRRVKPSGPYSASPPLCSLACD